MAKDIYHQIVKEALVKEGWSITHDPYLITRTNRKPYEVDLGAEKFIAAEKDTTFVAIEIKSFIGSSLVYDFHGAFGQYGIYRFFIEERDPERKLFLAITENVFNTFFQDIDIQSICNHFKVNILVFNEVEKSIITWLER